MTAVNVLETSKGNLKLAVCSSKLVPDIVVSLSFASTMNGCFWNKLCGNSHNPQGFPKGSEEAIIAYCLYSNVRAILAGDPQAIMKNKVASVGAGYSDGHFYICWRTKGTYSAARKSLGLALKGLTPSKMFSNYSTLVKSLGVSSSRNAFNAAANTLNKAIQASVHCLIVGNIKKPEQAVLDDFLSVVVKKLNPPEVEGDKKLDGDYSPCSMENLTEIKSKGWEALCLIDYIMSKVRGLPVYNYGDSVCVGLPAARWKTISNKLAQHTKDYSKKYSDAQKMGVLAAYSGLANSQINCKTALELVKKGLSSADVEKALKSSLA